ncbi:hypothetical protein BDB01DRAFT_845732 [Pilobolus umbonatus]|nr:hypothetical protein BDB01DRAFT_845732 [Pilobolus umbonatus]
MSAQSSYHRNSRSDLYSTILKSELSNKRSMPNNIRLSPEVTVGYSPPIPNTAPHVSNEPIHRITRPVSEIIKPDSFISPETKALDQWYEDLQHYESSLESMASVSLDPKYKEEIQHVDQWFCYLNEAERTATIYTLLQHSTQVQIRFFITVLQQLGKKDLLAAILSPAHPEKDMQNQLTGAMAKAEIEASQKLLSALPHQPPMNRTNVGRRNHIDRHSFALGDTEEYDRLFSGILSGTPDFLRPSSASFILDDKTLLPQPTQLQKPQRTIFDRTVSPRPKSVIEGDLSSIFNKDWAYHTNTTNISTNGTTSGFGHRQKQQDQAINRPKSADITQWSFSLNSSMSSKSSRDDPLSSPWTTFTEDVDRSTSPIDPSLNRISSKWNINNTSLLSNGRGMSLNEDTTGFRYTARRDIPPTVVMEADHNEPITHTKLLHPTFDNTNPAIFASGNDSPYSPYIIQPQHHSRPTSPIPSHSNSKNLMTTLTKNNRSSGGHYGQFLNPNDSVGCEAEYGYVSDHSDTSNRSMGSPNQRKKGHYAYSPNHRIKDKKNSSDVVDMSVLEDIPTWLRSLRLHKYNTNFESMKWQDMLRLDDQALSNKGVAALGARRKLLKVFEQVKSHCQINNIPY